MRVLNNYYNFNNLIIVIHEQKKKKIKIYIILWFDLFYILIDI